jgi:ATP/maltotriose-dependent transcriptional regulator MalT
LSRREGEVLLLVAQGGSNREVAAELGVRPSTVKKHLEHVYDKLGVHTRTAAVARARGALTGT